MTSKFINSLIRKFYIGKNFWYRKKQYNSSIIIIKRIYFS